MLSSIARGIAAGAAGVTALNATTYADMAVRGRPASSTPEQSVEKLVRSLHTDVPGTGETRQARLTGLGALLGTVTGIVVGAGYGAARACGWNPPVVVGGLAAGLTAMVGASAPMTVLGITDPRSWSTADWASDIVPHLAYGMVTAATFSATEQRRGFRLRLRAVR